MFDDKNSIIDLEPNEKIGRYRAETDEKKFYWYGTETYAQEMSGHYLLKEINEGIKGNSPERIFGVVDFGEEAKADRLLYERARQFLKNDNIKDKTRHASKSQLENSTA